ncbi:43 kDa receptor-associated protein of the synapse homolog [Pollicipes pollicipes]|nr:43 kDa receptor-associated protein of the synapse homolog [Pollicipes pollicipes]
MACHSKVGQQIARKRVEQGIKLFNQQRHQEAVAKWKEALRKIRREQDRFITLGYLCQAYMHWGKYRELVELAFQQLDIANSMEDNVLRAEAYLNLARGNERMGALDSALQYCRHSLYSQCDQSRTTGQVHLCLGNIYVTYSNFSKAIEHYELALKVARSIRDVGLELLIYVGMGQVFNVLKDYGKGLQLVAKAFELSKSFQICDLNMRHQRLALLHLVTPLRKLGRMSEAYECCQDALRMALEAGDRPLNARGLCAMGDILRQKSDGQRAYRRYEAALQMLTDMEDAFGRVLALDGMAKSISLLCRQKKVCDCKPLEAYTRLLDAVTNCGSKLLLRNTHQQLSGIYTALGDDENARLQERLSSVLTEEMELYCAVCNQPLGQEPGNSLEALPCSHIFHQQCARELMAKGERRKKKRICPQCRKTVNSRMMFVCYDDVKYDGHYPAFLANNTTHVQTPDHPL